MKTLVSTLLVASLWPPFSHANLGHSRTRYSCDFQLFDSKYKIEVAIDDVGDQEGNVKLLDAKTDEVLREESAFYNNSQQTFYFGVNDSENIFLDSLDFVGDDVNGPFAFTVINGHVSMTEESGPVLCQEIDY